MGRQVQIQYFHDLFIFFLASSESGVIFAILRLCLVGVVNTVLVAACSVATAPLVRDFLLGGSSSVSPPPFCFRGSLVLMGGCLAGVPTPEDGRKIWFIGNKVNGLTTK